MLHVWIARSTPPLMVIIPLGLRKEYLPNANTHLRKGNDIDYHLKTLIIIFPKMIPIHMN